MVQVLQHVLSELSEVGLEPVQYGGTVALFVACALTIPKQGVQGRLHGRHQLFVLLMFLAGASSLRGGRQ